MAVAERARARHARGDLDGALALLRELPPATSPDAALKLRVEIEEARESLGDAAAALEELRARAAAARDEAGERWAIRQAAARGDGATGAAHRARRRSWRGARSSSIPTIAKRRRFCTRWSARGATRRRSWLRSII